MSTSEAKTAREQIISASKQYIGTPYVYGGLSKTGIDCSGLIYTVVQETIGYELPRNSSAMYASVKIISDSQKEPGDLLFFRTTGGGVSHVAIYLGNNQFIHAASDGPNTGVIISSLQEAYWKGKYEGIVGRFLPSGSSNIIAVNSNTSTTTSPVTASSTASNPEEPAEALSIQSNTSTATSTKTQVPDFVKQLSADASSTLLWNLCSPNQFKLNIRGGSIFFHIKYTGWDMQPGFSFGANIEPTMGCTQFPLLLTISMPYGFRVYVGPVFTAGLPSQIGTGDRIYPSIFPGIIGASWQSGTLKAGLVEIAICQDISYTVFNTENGAALSFIDAFAAGFLLSTGVRVIIPFENIF